MKNRNEKNKPKQPTLEQLKKLHVQESCSESNYLGARQMIFFKGVGWGPLEII